MRKCPKGDKNYVCLAALAFSLGLLFALCGSIKLIVFLSAVIIIMIAVNAK